MSRHLEDLHPLVEDKARDWLSICKSKGYDVLITNTLRTNAEQNALYAKGRTAPGNVVTNAMGGHSYHNYGLAIDFCPLVNGKCAWDRIDLFTNIAEIAESVGFEWGARWNSIKDYPHLQMTFGLSITDLLSGKEPTKFEHWSESSHAYLLSKWLDNLEKRFDDGITRGEVFSLLERILRQLED